MGALRATRSEIQKFYILLTEGIYVFIMSIRKATKIDY